MYGTIARLRARPGLEEQLNAYANEIEQHTAPGWVASYVFRTDADPDEFYMVALFESKAHYVANAGSPEQDAEYRRLRALLVADPEWHDGEVVFAASPS